MSKKKHILIVSDTHHKPERLYDCVDQDGPFDLVLHMGDMVVCDTPIEEIVGCPMQAVRGNCDYRSEWPSETLIEVGSHLIFMTHGHNYGVNYGLEELESAARDYGADIAMYGHTHIPHYEETEDGMIILNPGSLGNPRQHPAIPTYMIMDIDEDTREISFTRRVLGQEKNEEEKGFWKRFFDGF